jgi:hypothetical protein
VLLGALLDLRERIGEPIARVPFLRNKVHQVIMRHPPLAFPPLARGTNVVSAFDPKWTLDCPSRFRR